MIGTYISLKSDKYNIEIPLERRITYLRGNSGDGKTLFVDLVLLAKSGSDPSIDLCYSEGYDIDVIASLNVAQDVSGRKDSILILDDSLQTEEFKFSNAVANVVVKNNLYLLIINRVDMPPTKGEGSIGGCDYAVGSILWIERNDINRVVSRFIDSIPNQAKLLNNKDCLILGHSTT